MKEEKEDMLVPNEDQKKIMESLPTISMSDDRLNSLYIPLRMPLSLPF